MTTHLTAFEARDAIRDALLAIVPDAPLDEMDPAEDLREALELDSLDFQVFVERLSAASGARIDEDDYDRLRTLESCVDLLTRA